MAKPQGILSKGTLIDGRFTVRFFLKHGAYAQTYRVKDNTGKTLFLKLFQPDSLHTGQWQKDGSILELEVLHGLQHPNICHFVASGTLSHEGINHPYLVLDFISGETLAQTRRRQKIFSPHHVKSIALGVLAGLKALHELPTPILHNDINHENIMLDMSEEPIVPRIIDFGYARPANAPADDFQIDGLEPFYLAPESLQGQFSVQSDLYAVGALMYHLAFGKRPWEDHIKQIGGNDLNSYLARAKQAPLPLPIVEQAERTGLAKLLPVITRALAADPADRFADAKEMLAALQPDMIHAANATRIAKPKEPGTGFDQIAGMRTLKQTLQEDVVQALADRTLYAEYGLTIPNGMLLFGPPGCGKSFIAQKLAEEVGHHYMEVKPSDLASIYIHGSQEKIGQLFNEAKANAPTILNFEEFDALVPRRDSHHGAKQSGEVNEFLAQLNNCGKEDVFVIATTNQPALIDPAVLRAGRIDKVIYVAPPDREARAEMFKMILSKRPSDDDIDYQLLADRTQGYVAIDIQHLVDEAARTALRARSRISAATVLEAISKNAPSVAASELRRYEEIRIDFESQRRDEPKRGIGFHKR